METLKTYMTLYVEQVQEQLQKTYESLALAGSFDKINDIRRKQYIYSNEKDTSLIEKIIVYSNKVQNRKKLNRHFYLKTLRIYH